MDGGLKQQQQTDRCNYNRGSCREQGAAAWCRSMLDQTKSRLMTRPPTRAVSKTLTNNCLLEAQLEKVNTFDLRYFVAGFFPRSLARFQHKR